MNPLAFGLAAGIAFGVIDVLLMIPLAANLSEAFWQRAERLTNLRRDEQRQMQEYVRLESGHMEFLIRALDGDPGTIPRPSLPPLPTTTDPAVVRGAIEFLRRTSLPIEPRG